MMKLALKSVAAAVTFAGLLLSAESALAGCGPDGLGTAAMKPMVYHGDNGGSLLRTNFFGPFTTTAITGLWEFRFTALGNVGNDAPKGALPLPDGTPVDAGYVTWHDDGTELMNSGRAPASGNFCMGVWKQVGPESYRLNHWALAFIPQYQPGVTQSWSGLAGGVDEAFQALGPANIQETVTLGNHGNSYSGVFRLTQYVNDGTKTPITDISGAPVAFVVVGTITATRITP